MSDELRSYPEILRERIQVAEDEIARLTAMLHAAQAHEDWEYTLIYLKSKEEGWERNPEAETPGGDECWRRRKDGGN